MIYFHFNEIKQFTMLSAASMQAFLDIGLCSSLRLNLIRRVCCEFRVGVIMFTHNVAQFQKQLVGSCKLHCMC